MKSEDGVQLACFRVGNETYGADILGIKEIILFRQPMAVPKAPAFMEGIINLRGNVIPVVDMRKRLDIPAPEGGYKRAARIIIIKLGKRDIGIIVDSIDRVIEVAYKDIDDKPDVASGIGPEYLKGVAMEGADMVMILDMEKLLTTKERVSLERAGKLTPSSKAEDAGAEGGKC